MTLSSAAILLFLVMDAFGNMPLFASALESVPVARRVKVVSRELLIALAVLMVFLLMGARLLEMLQISNESLRIAGGLILFLISIKMVFGGGNTMFSDTPAGEPFIVPLAIPYVAGPSAIATVLLLAGQYPARTSEWLLALLVASAANAVVLILSTKLMHLLGTRVLCAMEKLMGLLLTAVAVEMFVGGIRSVLTKSS